MSQFKEDMKAAWQASMPVFKQVAKAASFVAAFVLFVLLNLLLCESGIAIIALWVFTSACMIVSIQYHRVKYNREEEERTKRHYEKRDADWQARYGYPYPYSR